jgi:hypothetical protein
LEKLSKLRIPVLIGYDDDVMGRSKRANEARTVVDQVTGGRPSPRMRALLNFIDQFIGESFGRREYSLSLDIVEHTTSRFREELEVIFDTIARRNSLRGKVPIFGLEASTSMG